MVEYIVKFKKICTKQCHFWEKWQYFADFSISIVVLCFSKGDETNG